MSVLDGAARCESTVTGGDFGPRRPTRTRYPVPGLTSRKSNAPRPSTRLRATRRPRRFSSCMLAPGEAPVTDTCSTLPCALYASAAPVPIANAHIPATATAQSRTMLLRIVRYSAEARHTAGEKCARPRYGSAMRARVGVPVLLLLLALLALPAAASAAPGYAPVQFIDRELAGGEPLVMYDAVHKSYIYTAHEGTTHLY